LVTSETIFLTPADLSLAALLVLALALVSRRMGLALAGQIIVAALRTTIQLCLVGLVLKVVFSSVQPLWIAAMAAVMLIAAAREVMARQRRRYTGWWGFGMGAGSMFVSSFAITMIALMAVIGVDPWYTPQYAIPLLGMMLGNTMTGIALGLDRLTEAAWERRRVIEARLMLGSTWSEAIADIRRSSARSAMIPSINAMAAAGLVSLPGMMTGQILAGNPPVEAVKYQILIMFIIAAGTGFGALIAVWAGSRRLFDDRHRLCLDRLSKPLR
jgi:putative ABC transport system permease protein